MSEVVTFGEAMLRLSPPGHQRLEHARTLEVWPAGAELNVAVGLARLGTSTAWVSRLPENPLGRLVAAHARSAGVDVDRVLWSDAERLGLYFVEVGAPPRPSAAHYDRAGSAFATLDPDAFDWPALLAGARAFHTSGITAALSEACARATLDALAAARAAGCHTSYDLNFRSRLAPPERWRERAEAVAGSVDLVLTSTEDAERVFGARGEPGEIAEELRHRLGVERVVLSWRVAENGRQRRLSVATGIDLETVASPPFHTVDPVGGGDAFCAGFLHGFLHDGLRRGLELGGAAAALKQSIPGDAPLLDADEVAGLLTHATPSMAR